LNGINPIVSAVVLARIQHLICIQTLHQPRPTLIVIEVVVGIDDLSGESVHSSA